MARAPLPGRCKTRLLAAHSPEWVTGLVAAMLRDTIDGLQSVEADEYLVFVAPVPPLDGEAPAADTYDTRAKLALDVLARHVPAPWQLLAQPGDEHGSLVEHAFTTMFDRGASYALVSGSDAPSFPTELLIAALADEATHAAVLVGPSDDGGYHLIGMPRAEPRLLRDVPWSTADAMETTRVRSRELGLPLRELAAWYDVDEPADVLRLLDEMRTHPERAPRTAQFFVKNG